jgi:hypothetical protein
VLAILLSDCVSSFQLHSNNGMDFSIFNSAAHRKQKDKIQQISI